MSTSADSLAHLPEGHRNLEFGELKTANHLLGDRAGLEAAWARDGYWYFKGVLDTALVAQLRDIWIDYLHRRGLIDPDVSDNLHNGAAVPEGEDLSRVHEFNDRELHKVLTTAPSVNAFMQQALGDEPFWLPICEYRANAPVDDPTASRLIYPHQDGFYSRDMPMKICWFPIDSVDLETGGCAWVEGAHRGPILHDVDNPPLFPIPVDRLPTDGWKSANFEPGDIVIFDLNLPHSGLTNISPQKRFRMSFDIRVTGASGHVPTIGPVVSLSETQVVLQNERTGQEESYRVTDETYVRNTMGQRRIGADIPTTFDAGAKIMVNSLDGKAATLVRSTH